MSLERGAMDMAMRAKAGLLRGEDAMALVICAARRLDAEDPLWRSLADLGGAVARGSDAVAIADAGNEILERLGVIGSPTA